MTLDFLYKFSIRATGFFYWESPADCCVQQNTGLHLCIRLQKNYITNPLGNTAPFFTTTIPSLIVYNE
jgi:hypothetical protein